MIQLAYKNVNLGDVYRELKEVRRDLDELRSVFIPEEKISSKEKKELKVLFKGIGGGRATNWRHVSRK